LALFEIQLRAEFGGKRDYIRKAETVAERERQV
jgi:hypothetical protein